jgi:hypothetical protein
MGKLTRINSSRGASSKTPVQRVDSGVSEMYKEACLLLRFQLNITHGGERK